MRKQFKVQIAKQIFESIMTYGTVSPVQLNNACELLGISPDPKRKNYLMMYFMVKEPYDNYERHLEATDEEIQQITYITTHMGENLREYITGLSQIRDMKESSDATETAEISQPSVTMENQSHSEKTPLESLEEDLRFYENLDDEDKNKKLKVRTAKAQITKLKKKYEKNWRDDNNNG